MDKRNHAWAIAAAVSAMGLTSEAHADALDRNAYEALFNEPITLSATGAPQRVTDAPVDMTIITQDEIRSSGAVDIPGVLERLANVDVMRTSAGQADVSIRGYNTTFSPRLLVLVNGRQVYLDDYGMTNWDAIPVQMSEIRQIEVVSGPNTALFGFNAVAGVVNIITYDPLLDDINEIDVRAGAPNYVSESGVWTTRLAPHLGVRLSVGGFDAEALPNDDAAARAYLGRDSVDPQARAVSLSGAYDINPRWRANVEATWSRDERTDRFTVALFDYPFETNSLKFDVSGDTDIGLLQAQIYSNFLDLGFQNRTTVASMSFITKPGPAHTLRLAAEFRHNVLEQGGGTLAYDVQSLSAMWNWQATPQLALTTALRADALELGRSGGFVVADFPFTNHDYDQNFTELSYNLGAVYRMTDHDALRLSAARGIGSPSLDDYGYVANYAAPAGESLFVAGDPRIPPLVVYNGELGWEHEIPSLGGRMRAALFWQKNEDLRSFGSRQQIFAVSPVVVVGAFPEVVGSSEMHGLDLELQGRRGEINWFAQYSWRALSDNLKPAAMSANLDYQATSPAHVLTGGLSWTRDGFELGADARYTSATRQFGEGVALAGLHPVDAYVQMNAHASWRLTDALTVQLDGRNLLDSQTQTVGLTPVERSLYVTLRARL